MKDNDMKTTKYENMRKQNEKQLSTKQEMTIANASHR